MVFWNKGKSKGKVTSAFSDAALAGTTPTSAPAVVPILGFELTKANGEVIKSQNGEVTLKVEPVEDDFPLDGVIPNRDTYSGPCTNSGSSNGIPVFTGRRTFAEFKSNPKNQNDEFKSNPKNQNDPRDKAEYTPNERSGCAEIDAHLISSFVATAGKHRVHAPAIDIDHRIHIRESSPGKFHLFIDRLVEEEDYFQLLDLLAKMGIVEQGYASVSRAKKASYVRMPDIKKGDDPKVIVANRKEAAVAATQPTGLIDMLQELNDG